MKVCVVIPSTEHRNTAGVRIRYERLAVEHAAGALEIVIAPMEGIGKSREFDSASVYIFSKTYSSLCLVLARRLKAMNKVVGFDLFDDYFSQPGDARLQLFRMWLTQSAGVFDFFMCSTERLRDVVRRFQVDIPLILMPDSAPPVDLQRLRMLVVRKMEAAQRSKNVNVLWFGIGSNPFFPVGIQDLTAYGTELANLRRDGWDATLEVLTNPSSLTSANLARLAQLPIPYRIEPWSLEAETAALERSFVCFIPVNGQEFSQAKTLNRAIAALSSGSQIISNGFPLYKSMAELTYESCQAFMSDLRAGRLRSRPETVPLIERMLSEQANPFRMAEEFESFAGRLSLLNSGNGGGSAGLPATSFRESGGAQSPALAKSAAISTAFVHGSEHDVRAHKLASRLGALSIKSPFTHAKLNFDVYFNVDAQRSPTILLGSRARDLIPEPYKTGLSETEQGLWEIDRELVYSELRFAEPSSFAERHLIKELVYYRPVMTRVISACQKLLPGIEIYVSERGNLRTVDYGL